LKRPEKTLHVVEEYKKCFKYATKTSKIYKEETPKLLNKGHNISASIKE